TDARENVLRFFLAQTGATKAQVQAGTDAE
ncbi:MAG: hypothetical protein QOG85_211, partial [Gaiellaceae bacterium]|nr:hypothetical protein [Gaiellaceae bacterium]